MPLRIISLAAAFFVATCPPAAAQAMADDTELGPAFILSLGGKLYDDLWKVLDASPPAFMNPAFGERASVAPRESWRCVTCHGWDYDGAVIDGLVFPSLQHLRNVDPDRIVERLRDPSHPVPVENLPDLSIQILGFFLSKGQYDPGTILTSMSGPPVTSRPAKPCLRVHVSIATASTVPNS
jgi:thiosulfate dehydrogenase